MKQLFAKYGHIGLSVLFGIAVFLFWAVGYPHALSYQEQYQLFLWTTDYFCERVCVPGGLADWLGELIVQFYYITWLGALLVALLFVAMQRLSLGLLPHHTSRLSPFISHLLPLTSYIPPFLLWWLMGDINVLLSLPVAVVLALALANVVGKVGKSGESGKVRIVGELGIIPLAYWLIGPAVWVYIPIRTIQLGWKHLWSAGWLVATQLTIYVWIIPQWPLQQVLATSTYYRIPMQHPQWTGYDGEMYELIRLDYLIRNEQWDEVISRAEQHVVRTAFWSNCVNLALSQKRMLAERQFDFYQSGEDALIMPRLRDQTSNLPSAEAFFRLGLVNSAQRYMFDIQESILNGKKSGRCTKRIVECMLINGHYQTARKYLALLKKSLFYRNWAEEAERYLDNDAKVNQHPLWGRLRQLRFKNDFLFSYEEKEKIMGLLFMDNHNNKMALDYFIGELLLRGDVQGVMQYLPWAEQYGDYRYMPMGYQDAVRTIQSRGQAEGTKYGEYVKRMMRQKGGAE